MQKIDVFDFRKRRTNNSRSIDNVDLFLNEPSFFFIYVSMKNDENCFTQCALVTRLVGTSGMLSSIETCKPRIFRII